MKYNCDINKIVSSSKYKNLKTSFVLNNKKQLLNIYRFKKKKKKRKTSSRKNRTQSFDSRSDTKSKSQMP